MNSKRRTNWDAAPASEQGKKALTEPEILFAIRGGIDSVASALRTCRGIRKARSKVMGDISKTPARRSLV